MTQIFRNLRQAGAEAADMFQIFGTEAAPAIMSAVNMSSESFESLIAIMSHFSGKAAKVAAEMDAGIGGQLRQLQSAWEAVQIAVGEAIDQHNSLHLDELVQAINQNKDALVELALAGVDLTVVLAKAASAVGQFLIDWKEVVLLMGGAALAIKAVSTATRIMIALQGAQWFLATGQAVTVFSAAVGAQGLGAALALARTRLLALTATSMTAFFFSGTTGAAGMALALGKFGLAGAAVASVAALGYLGYKLVETHGAEKAAATSAALLTDTQKRLTERLKEISAQLGINIPNMETFNRLNKAGAIVADEASGRWRLSSQSVAEGILSQVDAAKKSSMAVQELQSQREAAARNLAVLQQQLADEEKRIQQEQLQAQLRAAEQSVQIATQKVQQSLEAEKRLANEIVALEERKLERTIVHRRAGSGTART